MGLFADTPKAGEVFAQLAEGSYKADAEVRPVWTSIEVDVHRRLCTPRHTQATPAAWAYGASFIVDQAFVSLSESADAQELAYRRRTGSRKTPPGFKPSQPARGVADADVGAAPLPPGALSVRRGGPGPEAVFG